MYTVTYTASDQAGNQTACTVTVTVPHDQYGDSSNIAGAEKSLGADEKASMAEL
ncbi:HYR domain-containing protein [Paenibacillus sp. SSG-1]|uniref:HYR domain-containing protein n=1 Tax=Paenibacillus sp. SSG-1 TaxID=1443669 RepID=UPI00117D8AAD|nr:HYR domain-containing protein [Paenibacillus sp. SSG-1]